MRKLTSVRVASLLLTSCVAAGCGPEFVGDGQLADKGFWSARPRYEVELQPTARLDDTSTYVFRFKGLPQVAMTLTLRLNPDVSLEAVQSQRGRISIKIVEETSRLLCQIDSPLSELKAMQQAGRPIELWAPECRDLMFDKHHWYELRLNAVIPGIPMDATPRLTGGGWDSL
jgi:hypothetical protein